jgi:CDP-glucose 4,6-dehydratase
MATFLKAFAGSRVLVTGHTGFKGSWLSEWLLGLEADVTGLSLPPATRPALFEQLGLAGRMNHLLGDIRDPGVVARAVSGANPDYVFHLAAQPIVREAHVRPAETWATNVMGTVNLLDAVRLRRRPCAVVVVTTDKVYAPRSAPHKEEGVLGADEPYGGSKAAVELAVAAWRNAYFSVSARRGGQTPLLAFATARSGNVIGGGDWARDRLVPDCVRAFARGRPLAVRYPRAVRPWQHVLDPLAGYLRLAAELREARDGHSPGRLGDLSGAFNFGPRPADHRSVGDLLAAFTRNWPGTWKYLPTAHGAREQPVLRLSAAKAGRLLGWKPRWNFERAVRETALWYREAATPAKAQAITVRQLAEYTAG